jgi:isocitrate/isopropylmalate dehydrogenase
MMLQWLARPATIEAATAIRRAVVAALADPARRTPDLGGKLSTGDMTTAVIDHL